MELKNFILQSSVNLVDNVIDEVALEGLDGITLEALWQRMAVRLQEELPLSDSLMEQIWSICSKVKGFSFFELKKAREPLIIFDRFELLNEEELKKTNVPQDIYPHFPIDDLRTGNRGSSSSYNTRVDITLDARYYALEDIISHYGHKFVIVASQTLRERALIGDTPCPIMEMNVLQYCFLERVGRARYHGDISHGKSGLTALSDDPKSMFYHRKFLLKQKLITKQAYTESVSGNCYSSSLLHLTRFYVERRPKFIILSENIINFLKAKENCICSYDEIKEKLQIKVPLRKIFKTPLLKNIIRTDIKIPYGNLYPNTENLNKSGYTSADKIVRAVQLVKPNVDIRQFWGRHDNPEDDECYDLDISEQKLNSPYLKQANRFVEETRQKGLSQSELGSKLGMTKLHTRTILRNLVKTKIVATYMNDVGKQRVTKYISKKYENTSEMSKQLEQELDKMKEYKNTQAEKNDVPAPIVPMEVPRETIYPMHEEVFVADEVQNNEVQRDERLFATVNKIFSKYKNLRSRPRYQYTSLNLSQLHATTFWNPSLDTFTNGDPQNNEMHSEKIENNEFRNNGIQTNEFQNNGIQTNEFQNNVVQNNEFQNIGVQNNDNRSTFNNQVLKDVRVKLVSSKPLVQKKEKGRSQIMGFFENNKNTSKNNVTYRLLKRANIVMEAVRHNKVIDDVSKLLKLIKSEEDKEGYDVKIDKRSLARLLQRLAKDNLIKYIKLTLSDHERQKIITFICDPSIDKNDSYIQSAVEQAKIKFCLLRAPNVRASKQNPTSKKKPVYTDIYNSETPAKDVSLFLDPKVGKKYGYSPKFLRMKALHNILFYLVYEHPGNSQTPREELITKFRNDGISIDDELASQMTEIYTNEVDWKMFIPPLPKHPVLSGWSEGWALMCDVLIRLPLSIFVKLYNIPYVIPDLESYLEHPIKKHFLVKDISPYLRNVLLKSRKYIFVIHQTVTRLSYLGLIQFGPQKLKEKDQIFLFVNRRSQLMDTTPSAVGYHRIENKAYTFTRYEFKSLQDVEKYWYNMWEICINTCLGGRLAVQGKDILLENLPKKAEMILAAKPRPPEEVLQNDNGEVPGDHQGAAGLDSALFSHLKRNWTWGSTNYTYQQYKTPRNRSYVIEVFQHKTLEEAIEKSTKEAAEKEVFKEPRPKRAPKAKGKTKATAEKQIEQSDKSTPEIDAKRKAYVRRVLPRKKTVRNRVKYDEVDYRALQRMDKLRVDWDPHEDNILLMCKVAMMYLFPNPRKQFVTFIAVRDTLRAYSPCSHNKTSRACQRRLLYMLKQPQTISSVMLGIEEIKQNYVVNKRFNGLVDRIKGECHNPVEYEEKVAKIFKELVAYISKKYYDISNMEPRDPIMMPETVQMFNFLYEIRHPSKTLRPKGFTKDVENVNDIHVAMIYNVIHSSMCSGKDKRSWAYHLFKIYQQYSEANLRTAMLKIRTDQMVSMKKATSLQKHGNCMPMTNAQFQLSSNYEHKFQTKWPYSVFLESYNLLYKMIQWQCENQSPELNFTVPEEVKGTEVLPITGGIVAGIHDFFAKDLLDFDIEMPDQIIMLDPRLQEKDEVYLKIAKRYQSLLINYAFATDSAGPRSETYENENLIQLEVDEERQDDIPQPEIMQRPLIRKGTIEDNYTIENENTVFLQDPHALWNQTESEQSDPGRVRRGIKRSLESEDEDVELIERNPKLEEEDPTFKRPRTKLENDLEVSNETNSEAEKRNKSIKTVRQFYANNLKKVQALLQSFKEPSQSLQRAIAREKIHIETNLDSENESLTENENSTENSKKKRNETVAEDPLRVSDQTQNYLGKANRIQKTDFYTRIGMLKMRDEYNNISVADSHHAHDFFVVNSFNIFYKLTLPEAAGPRRLDIHQGYEIPSEILPLKLNTVDKLINNIKKTAIIPRSLPSYLEFQETMAECSNVNWDLIDAICMFIKQKNILGATLLEISNTYGNLGETVCEILSILMEHGQILRSGVTRVCYIHQQYFEPWLISSYKILRLDQENKLPIQQGSVYHLGDESKSETSETTVLKVEPKSPSRIEEIAETESMEICDEENTEIPNEQNESKEDLRRSLRQKNVLKDKDVPIPDYLLDLHSTEEVRFVIKPWIHVDGSLNRRVLDRMMGAVLSYCIKHPGTMLNKVQNRFLPALQPFHTRELVEFLVELGCLNVKVFKLPRVTLFSVPKVLQFSGIPGLAQEEELMIEPAIAATLRFGTYLSNKTYTTDFLSTNN